MPNEYVYKALVVRGLIFPSCIEKLYGAYARQLEELAREALQVEAPHLNIICGKSKGLYHAVAYRTAVCRTIVVEYHLLFLFDSFDERMNNLGIIAAHDGVGQDFVVVYRI